MKLKIKSVKWLQNFDNSRKDSIWYGGDIVSINLGRYQVIIGAYGDIRATINGEWYVDKCNGGNFADYLREQNIHNDEDLKNADINYENNNWFEAIIWDNKNKDYVDSWDTIIDDLDADDNFSWLPEWLENIVK